MSCNHRRKYKILTVRTKRENAIVPNSYNYYDVWYCPSCKKARSDMKNDYLYEQGRWYDATLFEEKQ